MRTAIEESAGVCGTVIDQSTSSPVIDNRYVVVCQARQRLLRLPPTARLLAVPSAPSAVNRVVDVDVHAAARRRLPLKKLGSVFCICTRWTITQSRLDNLYSVFKRPLILRYCVQLTVCRLQLNTYRPFSPSYCCTQYNRLNVVCLSVRL